MGWAAVAVLGLALEITVVIWLARTNTARWERDHRATRAAVRAREEASLRLRAAALVVQRVPHPHLTHLPHVHLPPRVADRLTHPRGTVPRPALHRAHLHLPHLHLPHLHLTRRRPGTPGAPEAPVAAPEDVSTPSQEQPAP